MDYDPIYAEAAKQVLYTMVNPTATAALLGMIAGASTGGTKAKPSLRGTQSNKRTKYALSGHTYKKKGNKKKNWKVANRQLVGLPQGHSHCKTCENVAPGGQGNYNSAFLTANVLLLTQGYTKGTEINQRLRDEIFLSGLKLDMVFQNGGSSPWCVVNWAVVHPKEPSTLGSFNTPEIFRDYGINRSWDSDGGTGTSGKHGISWCNAPINTDRYVVLSRGRFTLVGGINEDPPPIYRMPNNYNGAKLIRRYIPIKRKMTFDGGTGTPYDRIYLITWPANPFQESNPSTTYGVSTRVRCISYFRETAGA